MDTDESAKLRFTKGEGKAFAIQINTDIDEKSCLCGGHHPQWGVGEIELKILIIFIRIDEETVDKI